MVASGLRLAHLRVETAISASCSCSCPVLVHVPARGQCIAADRLRDAPDILELHREDWRASAEGAASLALLSGAVDDQRHVAIAFFDRHGSVGDMSFER